MAIANISEMLISLERIQGILVMGKNICPNYTKQSCVAIPYILSKFILECS